MKKVFILLISSVGAMQSAWVLNPQEEVLLKRVSQTEARASQVAGLPSAEDYALLPQILAEEKAKYKELISFNAWLDKAEFFDIQAFPIEEDDEAAQYEDAVVYDMVSDLFSKLTNHELIGGEVSGIEALENESLIEFLIKKYCKYTGPKSAKLLTEYIDVTVPPREEFQQIVESYIARHSINNQQDAMSLIMSLTIFGEKILAIQGFKVSRLEFEIDAIGKEMSSAQRREDVQSPEVLSKINEIFEAAKVLHEKLRKVDPLLINAQRAISDIAHESGFAPSFNRQVQEDVRVANGLLAKIKTLQAEFAPLAASLVPFSVGIKKSDGSDWEEIDWL